MARGRLPGIAKLARFVALAGGLACHRASADARNTAATPPDSVEGLVQVTGVQAASQTVLVTDSGSTALTLTGSPLLRHLAGLRVSALGTRDDDRFQVSRFAVIAANGVRAADGRLSSQGNGLILVTASGAHYPVNSPSAGLRALVGHRVWISGLLDGQVIAYGVID